MKSRNLYKRIDRRARGDMPDCRHLPYSRRRSRDMAPEIYSDKEGDV